MNIAYVFNINIEQIDSMKYFNSLLTPVNEEVLKNKFLMKIDPIKHFTVFAV